MKKKLIDESIFLAKEITKNSFIVVKTSKMLINKGMDADINTGLRLQSMAGHYVLHMRTGKNDVIISE